jgi:glycosyltransferase involved in cell wall biosynthesis
MKLLYLLPEYVNNAGGGIITFYRHLLPLLAAQGHQVRVIVGSGVSASRDPSPVMIDGVRVEGLDEARLPVHYARFARYAAMPSLRRYLAGAWAMHEQAALGKGYDAVETTDWGLLFLPWIVESGPASIVQLHGSSGQIDMHDPVQGEEAQGALLRLLERTAIARATEVQGYSQSNVRFWQSQLARPVTRILAAWKPVQQPAPGAGRSDRGLVVGRVQKWKGPQVLCEALRFLGPRAPAIDWVGRDMPYGQRGRTMAQHLKEKWPDVWGHKIVHHGQASVADTLQRQACAGFVIVPSEWDTFNFTCVEAMAAGTPVICSTGAGASELIEHGVNGFIFEKHEPQSLVQAIDRLMSMSASARAQLAQAGQATVLRALDPKTNAQLRLAAYRDAMLKPELEPLSADDWLRLAVSPRDAEAESFDFLDLVPLRRLLSHSGRRLMRKLST